MGDRVTAFFDAESAGSESAAVRACIGAARELQASMPAIAARSGLSTDEVVVRAGLHYTQLAELDSATDKARRDAPAVPVCDVRTP